jgi:hypothetical protein
MTATYWEIGRRIVESEQQGQQGAEYGEALIKQLAGNLEPRFVRGLEFVSKIHFESGHDFSRAENAHRRRALASEGLRNQLSGLFLKHALGMSNSKYIPNSIESGK